MNLLGPGLQLTVEGLELAYGLSRNRAAEHTDHRALGLIALQEARAAVEQGLARSFDVTEDDTCLAAFADDPTNPIP